MTERPANIRDVATEAGVSRTTVSLVLNNSPIPAAATREKVLRAASRLNYAPSPLYRQAFKNGRKPGGRKTRTNTFGFLSSEVIFNRSQQHDGYYSKIRLGIERAVNHLGYELLVRSVPENLTGIPAMVSDGKVDGLLIEAKLREDIGKLLCSRIPIVFVDSPSPGNLADAVIADVSKGVQAQYEYLWSLGHRRIATFQASTRSHETAHFVDAYKELCRKHHAESMILERDISISTHKEVMQQVTKEIMAMQGRPTALITWDSYACTVLENLERAGVSVPQEFSVIGMDDIMMARMTRPKLTSYRFPLDEMGAAAVEMLESRICEPGRSARLLSLNGKLIIRESCGAPHDS